MQLPAGGRCWAHAADDDLDRALEQLRTDANVDARGVSISVELFNRFLAAVPRDDNSAPILRQAAFQRASFQGRPGFHSVSFQGPTDFTDATFQNHAGFTDVTFLVAVEGAVFRAADEDLTYTGRVIEIVLRIAGPVLLALAVISIRGRVRR